MLRLARSGSEPKRPSIEVPIEKGNRGKRGPRPARRRKSGEAKGRPSHIGRADLRDDLLQHSIRNARNTQIRSSKSKQLSVYKVTSLNTGFPTPFLRSLMLRTCARAPSAGTIKAPVSSASGTRTLPHKGENCFPISRFSSDLD